jgi:uncharacterized membrane protein
MFRGGFKPHIRRTMAAGVILLIPIVLTYLVMRWVFDFLDGVLKSGIENAAGVAIPGLGVVALLVVVYMLGLIWDYDLGRRIIRTGQTFLIGLPIIGAIYSPARQLIRSFSDSTATGFRRVVVIEYPRPGAWTIGFLTAMTTGKEGMSWGVVYIPTAPTPNSGWVAMVPENDILDTDLSVQDAMTMVLSGGIASPSRIPMRVLGESRF